MNLWQTSQSRRHQPAGAEAMPPVGFGYDNAETTKQALLDRWET